MNRSLKAASALALAVSLVVGASFVARAQEKAEKTDKADDAWKEFSDEAGGFKVDFPGTPTSKVETIPTDAGGVEAHTFLIDKGDTAYMIMYADYPESFAKFDAAQKDKVLDGARDGAAKNVHGTVLGEKKITMNGHPGREFIVRTDQLLVMTRMYLAKARLYQVMHVMPRSRLLSSFKLEEAK